MTDSNQKPLLFSYTDAMAQLGGIGRTTLWQLMDRGELDRVNIGRRGFVTAASLSALVDRMRAKSATEAHAVKAK